MMKPSILIADDEREIADLLEIHLQKEGYQVNKAVDGQEALQMIRSHPIDLVILDIMMPNLDGFETALQIRAEYQMPIIFLSAKSSDFDKIQGLMIGADDYLTKPFNPMELLARVNAQLRRYMKFNQPRTNDISIIETNGLKIDPDQRSVTLYDQNIELTPKEFDILYLLASHPKKVFSTEKIFQLIWGEAYYESGNTVMVHIRTLRKKLGEDKRKNLFIKTVWGVGYAFNG
ncbi:response regulator transcription factor [Lederbergia ruris]|uniref:DNA-binding response regulator n=1 Tax=Lederbergia ruris TaxID=217495 RepID=A0ABQ4KDZ2_9BACI|nr:response regulator transcription factor [Lederbergia ruris]GIN56187.1 DNA-binding response regulator [Lederbergia ruris]